MNEFLSQINITVITNDNQVYPLSGYKLIEALEQLDGYELTDITNLKDVKDALESWYPSIMTVYETADYEQRQKQEFNFLERFKNVRLTFAIDNSDYESGECRISYKSLEPKDMLGWLREVDENFPLDSVQTEDELVRELSDTDLVISYIPTAEYLRLKVDKERQKYEAIASSIAAKHNVRPYSLDFLNAIDSETAEWIDRKNGLRGDGLCAGDGTMAGYYDMSDGYGEEIGRLSNLQNWLEQNVPLLWAQWQESKVANKQTKE